MSTAEYLAFVATGGFFFLGLLCGAWKYAHIHASAHETASAPEYVNLAHRAALMYGFAGLLIQDLVVKSRLSEKIELFCVGVLVAYFVVTLLSYVLHGLLRDTENQLAYPHVLGSLTVAPWLMRLFMVSLVLSECAAFLVLFFGALIAV